MTAPYVKTLESDQSYRVSTQSGSYVAIVVPAKKGPTVPTLVSSDTEYLKLYTEDQKVAVGDSLAHFSALAVLEKSDSLWVQRAVKDSTLTGGLVLKAASGDPSPLKYGLEDPSAYLFNQSEEASKSNQLSKIAFTSQIEGVMSGKYFVMPGHKKYVWFYLAGSQYTIYIDAIDAADLKVEAEYPANHLNLPGFSTDTGSIPYIYFVVDGQGVDPEISMKGEKLELTSEDNATAVAEKIAQLLLDKFSDLFDVAELSENHFKVICKKDQDSLEFGFGDCGFNVWTTSDYRKASVDPKPVIPENMEGIKVDIDDWMDAEDFARRVHRKLNTTAVEFKCTIQGSDVFIENSVGGRVEAIQDGNTGLELETLKFGGSAAGTACALIYGANPGEWNNRVAVKVFNYADYPEKVVIPNAFKISVFKISNLNEELESFTCSLDPSALDDYGNSLYMPRVLEGSYYIRGLVNDAIDISECPASFDKAFALAGGSNGNSPIDDGDMVRALRVFANKDEIPVTLLIDGGWASPAYQTEMLKIAKERMDCFAIFSTPITAETSSNYKNEIVDYRKNQLNANSSYGAMITPHVKVFDYFNNRDVWASPDGYLAGALMDAERNFEIWYPVLGFRRGILDVLDTRQHFQTGDMNYLYENGVNPIRFISGEGVVIWGQKTLQKAPSALDRINVRMMLIKVEPAIEELLENYIGEFNIPQTRNEVKTIVEGYLRSMVARNAITDFKVICDTSNNTPEVIANNEMWLWTYVKPTMAAEYITNKMIITPQGITLS